MHNIKNIQFFTKGKRGIIQTGFYRGKKVAVKIKNPASKAKGNLRNEALKLKKLNKYKIGPRLLFSGKDHFVYEFVKGEFILDFFQKASKQRIKKIIKDVFKQCYKLDKLKLNKEEMHHPVKHVIIGKKTVLVDFERCKKTKKPKNVTQFCQFMTGNRVKNILAEKGFKIKRENMIKLAQEYKRKQTEKNFKKILNEF